MASDYVTFNFYQEPKPEEVTYSFLLGNVDHFEVHEGVLTVTTKTPLFPTTDETEHAFIHKDEVQANYFSKEDLFARLLKRAEVHKEEAGNWAKDSLYIMAGHYQHQSQWLKSLVRDLGNGSI